MIQDSRYIEIAVGSTVNRNQSIKIEDLKTHINGQELYRSYYTFNADFPKHLETFKTVKSFKGKCYLDRIILDIDKSDQTDQYVLDKTRTCIRNMIDGLQIPESYIQPWFSGTGYHLQLPDIFGFEASKDLPNIVKETLTRYFPEADSNIYDRTRLIRVGWSLNTKTNLYKTPFTVREIMSFDYKKIHEESKTNFRQVESESIEVTTLFEPVYPTKSNNQDYGSADTKSVEVSAIAPCVQKMYNEGPQKGQRHTNMLRMISYYRRHGLPEHAVQSIIDGWAPDMETTEKQETVKRAFNGGYRFGCADKIMDKYCDPKCIYYPSKIKGNDPLIALMSAADIEKRYVERVRKNLREDGFNLKDFYPSLQSDFWFMPGELNILLGDTGTGKTALMQNIILKAKLPTIWLSLEVTEYLMYRRFQQIHRSKTKDEVDEHYMNNHNSWSQDLNFIKTLTMPPTIDAIKHLVAEEQPKVLVVDTLEDISSSNAYNADGSMGTMDAVIRGMRQILANQDIIIMCIAHITKSGSQNNVIDVHAGKHSSSIAQKADKVMAIEGDRDQQLRIFKSKKSRDEDRFETLLEFNPKYFQFKEIERAV